MILIHDWWPSIITEAFQLSYLWPQNGLGRRTCQHISRASKTRLQESTSQNGCDTNKGRNFDYCGCHVVLFWLAIIIQNYSTSSTQALFICFCFVTKLRSTLRTMRKLNLETEITLFWRLIGCVIHWRILANIPEILTLFRILNILTEKKVLVVHRFKVFLFWESFFLWSATMNGIRTPVLHQRGHCYLGLPTIKDECHFWVVFCKNKLRDQTFS